MRTSRKTDFRSRDIAKNNFIGIDISQGLDLEPPSLSPYFLLVITCVRSDGGGGGGVGGSEVTFYEVYGYVRRQRSKDMIFLSCFGLK